MHLIKESRYFKQSSQDELIVLFDTIFRTSHDGLYICDFNGNTVLFNEAFLKISGIPETLLINYTVFELVKNDHVPNSCAAVTLETGKTHNTFISYYNGKKALLTSTPVFDEANKILFVISNVRDITELNRLQTELRETKTITSKYKKELQLVKKKTQENEELIYRSKEMETIISMARRFSNIDSPILLLGESGVGKDVLAHFLHRQSKRQGSFVRVNCGAIPEQLLESELFGYEKGAFSGADQSKVGLFELAQGGTIFLDEIGDLPFNLQVKLLNVLQDFKIRRLGGTKSRKIDMRIIAATNQNLSEMVEQKTFRKDLYYRLNVLPITIPPLRKRKEDIPVLVFSFLDKLNTHYKTAKKIDSNTMEYLIEYEWPGNIRELKNIIERIFHLSEGLLITSNILPEFIQKKSNLFFNKINTTFNEFLPLNHAMNMYEKEYIKKVLDSSKTLKECADKLKIDISTLIRKKKKLGI